MSEQTKTCGACGATIAFVRSQAGRPIPVDVDYLTIVTDDGKLARGRLSHFATCTDPERFRGKGRAP